MTLSDIGRTLGGLAVIALVFSACRPAPGAPVESVVGDRVAVVFMIGGTEHSYIGFGTAAMSIEVNDLRPIGLASEADPTLFPDRKVYALGGVNPTDAIVLVDRSGATAEHGDPVLFTRDGISPPLVVGVCQYYMSPNDVGCSIPSPRP